jgi:hypothetical protein
MPIWVPPPPRPKWWRHPLRWYRWKPPEPPPMPEMKLLTYRRTSEVRDGATVYEIDGDWPWFKGPEAEGDDVPGLYVALNVHPAIRRDPRTRMVMSPEHYSAMRSMAGWPPGLGDPRDSLFGIQVEVSADGGAPRLENRAYPADYP